MANTRSEIIREVSEETLAKYNQLLKQQNLGFDPCVIQSELISELIARINEAIKEANNENTKKV